MPSLLRSASLLHVLRLTALPTLALCGPCVLSAQAQERAVIATVVTVRGEAQVQRAGATAGEAAVPTTALIIGDTIRTGANGKLSLLFSDGSQVRLNANTTVVLTPPRTVAGGRRVILRLVAGQIWAQLRPDQAIETPSGIAGVRGTTLDLFVGVGNAVTLTTLEGEVDFFNQFGSVTVTEAQQSVATPDAAPTRPITLQNADLIVEWTLDLNRVALAREKFFARPNGQIAMAPAPQLAVFALRHADDAGAQSDYGDALFNARQFAPALAQYERAAALQPENSAFLLRRGSALLELNRLDEAQTSLEKAAASAGDDAKSAQIVLAWLQLEREQPQAALTTVTPLLGDDSSGEAQLVQGLAQLRLARLDEAAATLGGLAAGSAFYAYQGESNLALLKLARNDEPGALQSALAATKARPASGLAQGNLALAYFFADQPGRATATARRAVKLAPDSLSAQIALGQAALASGDVDSAARAGARAAALDPQLPQAFYLLGVADAQRRDYTHAARALNQSLKLAPDFLPAVAALARVYTRMERKREAVALLTDASARQGENRDVLTALGEVYYEQADYEASIAAFQKAVAKSPTALAYAGLTRVALDANELNLAVNAGQKAVELAPQVAQYRAVLGKAYNFSRFNTQAEREFRAALALDPQNALALSFLGTLNEEGDARATRRTTGVTVRQAFLLEPAISRELFRGGTKTEITPQLGPDDTNLSARHRVVALDGKLNFYGRVFLRDHDGAQKNSDSNFKGLGQDTTFVAGPQTNFYLNLIHQRTKTGLSGVDANLKADDQNRERDTSGLLGARHRVGARSWLWLGYSGINQKDDRSNPNLDASFVLVPRLPTIAGLARVANRSGDTNAHQPEVRLDLPLGTDASRSGTLSVGAAYADFDITQTSDVRAPNGDLNQNAATFRNRQDGSTWLAYAHLTSRLGARLSVAAQLRYQRDKTRSLGRLFVPTGSILEGGTYPDITSNRKSDHLLPSLSLNFGVDARNTLRLLASQRVTETVISAFAPTDTILTAEGATLPNGLPSRLNTAELDWEHTLAPGNVVKLFAFRTTADRLGLTLSGFSNPTAANGLNTNLLITDVRRTGAGARYERQLTRTLFAQFGAAVARTRNATAGAVFAGDDTPYQPKVSGFAGLNYVDERGTKAALEANYFGSFFQDSGVTGAQGSRFGSKTTFDVLLAREPSVRNEVFLQVSNLFNTRQIAFNGVATGQRRLRLGWNARF